MRDDRRYILRWLSGMLMLLLLTACSGSSSEGGDEPVPTSSKPVLKIYIFPPDRPAITRADDLGNVKEDPDSAILGYLAYINNKPIIINPEGIYELKGENVEITSLSFPVDTQVNLEYHVNLQQTEDTSKVFQTSSFYRKVGQR